MVVREVVLVCLCCTCVCLASNSTALEQGKEDATNAKLANASLALREGNSSTAIELYEELGKAGVPEALEELARLYEVGKSGVLPRDGRLAATLYEKAHKKGGKCSGFYFGTILLHGLYGVHQDTGKGIQAILDSANRGCYEAQIAVGYRTAKGVKVEKNCNTALHYYHLAASQARKHFEEPGHNPNPQQTRIMDPKEASIGQRGEDDEMIQYVRYRAEKGDVTHQITMANWYFHGDRGLPRDHSQALRFYEMAAESGNLEGEYGAGVMHLRGIGTDKNLTRASEFIQRSASKNHGGAQKALGYMYFQGEAVEKNYSRALELFEKVAEQGDAEAIYNCGVMYRDGIGTEKNLQKAITYWGKSADEKYGHFPSMIDLGELYVKHKDAVDFGETGMCGIVMPLFQKAAMRGNAVERLRRAHDSFLQDDYDSALLQYIYAAEMGYEVAESNAAWLLDSHLRSSQDFPIPIAPALYERSALAGNVESRRSLGDLYYYGRGTKRDLSTALRLYLEAAASGDSRGAFAAAQMKELGEGSPANFTEAEELYRLSGKLGGENAAGPVRIALIQLQMRKTVQGALASSHWHLYLGATVAMVIGLGLLVIYIMKRNFVASFAIFVLSVYLILLEDL